MSTTKDTADRPSRYHVPGNPPPELEKICMWLAGDAKKKNRRGRLGNRSVIRGEAGKVARAYQDKGPCDDLCRFLLNEGIVVESNRVCYFDQDRVSTVLMALKYGQRPTPARGDTNRRIEEIRAQYATTTPAPTTDRSVPPAAREPMVVPDALAIGGPQKLPTDEGNVKVRLFLTKAEMEVWTFLFCLPKNVKLPNGDALRIALPKVGEVPESVDCNSDVFEEIIERFVRARVISVEGENKDGKRPTEFHVHPEEVEIEEIGARIPRPVDWKLSNEEGPIVPKEFDRYQWEPPVPPRETETSDHPTNQIRWHLFVTSTQARLLLQRIQKNNVPQKRLGWIWRVMRNMGLLQVTAYATTFDEKAANAVRFYLYERSLMPRKAKAPNGASAPAGQWQRDLEEIARGDSTSTAVTASSCEETSVPDKAPVPSPQREPDFMDLLLVQLAQNGIELDREQILASLGSGVNRLSQAHGAQRARLTTISQEEEELRRRAEELRMEREMIQSRLDHMLAQLTATISDLVRATRALNEMLQEWNP